MKPEIEPIRFGIPKNSQLRKDCEPLIKALELRSAGMGNMRTDLFPDVLVRELRVQDIAQMIRAGTMDLGIICDDILQESAAGQKEGLDASNLKPDRLAIGELVDISLLIRREDRPLFDQPEGDQQSQGRSIISPYPNITSLAQSRSGSSLRSMMKLRNAEIRRVFGQTESILRAGDIPNALAAVDVVRSGKTAEEFDLMVYGPPILSSRAILARSPGDSPRTGDVLQGIREKLSQAGLLLLADKTVERNQVLERLFSLLQKGFVIIDASQLPNDKLKNIGRISEKKIYYFRSDEEVNKTSLTAEQKDDIKNTLAFEQASEARKSTREMGMKKFNAWLGIDTSEPGVFLEADEISKPQNPYIPGFRVGPVTSSGYYDSHGNYRSGGGDGYYAGGAH